MKTTKGKWKIGYSSVASNPQIEIAVDGHRITNIPLSERYMGKGTNDAYDGEQEANAKLIAAAPEMIKEMQSYIEHLERNGRTRANSFYFSFKEVIKKATS